MNRKTVARLPISLLTAVAAHALLALSIPDVRRLLLGATPAGEVIAVDPLMSGLKLQMDLGTVARDAGQPRPLPPARPAKPGSLALSSALGASTRLAESPPKTDEELFIAELRLADEPRAIAVAVPIPAPAPAAPLGANAGDIATAPAAAPKPPATPKPGASPPPKAPIAKPAETPPEKPATVARQPIPTPAPAVPDTAKGQATTPAPKLPAAANPAPAGPASPAPKVAGTADPLAAAIAAATAKAAGGESRAPSAPGLPAPSTGVAPMTPKARPVAPREVNSTIYAFTLPYRGPGPDVIAEVPPSLPGGVAEDKGAAPAEDGPPLAPDAATPSAGTSVANRQMFFRQLTQQLKTANQQVLAEAIRATPRVTIEVAFQVDRRGRVLGARVARSSGDAALDEKAVGVIQRASPVPQLPPDMPQERVELSFPVQVYR